MREYIIERPIGLTSLCEEVERVCQEAEAYRHGARLRHLIIQMDRGNGRTTFLEYLTDMFKKHKILDFTCSREDYLELELDASSPSEVTNMFSEIEDAAVYANEYSNVVGIDVSDMARHIGTLQYRIFIAGVKKLCKTAFVVFYISSSPTGDEKKLVEGIITAVGIDRVKRMKAEPYSGEEICELIEKMLTEHDILIRDDTRVMDALKNLAFIASLRTVQDAEDMTDVLIHAADYSGPVPSIGADTVFPLVMEWGFDEGERTEAK